MQTRHPRKIIHVDMDAFYASVEQRDFPSYRGKPLIVGGPPNSRGVVAACSYEARRFGVHSAMPSAQAHRLCPRAIFVRPRFPVYRRVSAQLHRIFADYTDRIEPLSLDEAYLDVSDNLLFDGSATRIARDIKHRVHETTGLIASAGVSYNKFLAKIASDRKKPDGLYVIPPQRGAEFVAGLPIGAFYGIGKATEAKMKDLGIRTGADLRRVPLDRLRQVFGKAGEYYYGVARGIDERPVIAHRQRKSLGAETTFPGDLNAHEAMLDHLRILTARVAAALRAKGLAGRTLTIKVKYADFEQVTRGHSFADPVWTDEEFLPWLPVLLARTEASRRPVRLLGATISNLAPRAETERTPRQLALF